MKRLLFVGGGEQRDVVEMLRREIPSVAVCPALEMVCAAVRAQEPRLIVSTLSSLAEVKATLQAADAVVAGLPVIVICQRPLQGDERAQILTLLGERGTLLSPFDPTSLRATLRSWVQPSPDPAMLDSNALARVYARGGRVLADSLVQGFLLGAPSLTGKARKALLAGEAQNCIDSLEELAKQASSLGAVDVAEAIEEILDELIEGGHVGLDQWENLERSLDSTARFLAEQKRQDRTA